MEVECERKEKETTINLLYVVCYRGNGGYLVHGVQGRIGASDDRWFLPHL